MAIKLRDMRESFFLVNNEYLNGHAALCGIYATGVYFELCRHATKEQTAFPSIDHVAEKLSINRSTVIESIKILEKYNLIRKEKISGRNSVYYLLDKSEWSSHQSARTTSRPEQPVGHTDYTSRPHRLEPVGHTDPKNTNIRILTKNTPLPPKGECGFDLFWKAYPRRKSKGQAERAWASLRPNEQLVAKILQGIERAKTSEQWRKDGGQFIPYPATWIRAKGWEDEVEKPKSWNDKLWEK